MQIQPLLQSNYNNTNYLQNKKKNNSATQVSFGLSPKHAQIETQSLKKYLNYCLCPLLLLLSGKNRKYDIDEKWTNKKKIQERKKYYNKTNYDDGTINWYIFVQLPYSVEKKYPADLKPTNKIKLWQAGISPEETNQLHFEALMVDNIDTEVNGLIEIRKEHTLEEIKPYINSLFTVNAETRIDGFDDDDSSGIWSTKDNQKRLMHRFSYNDTKKLLNNHVKYNKVQYLSEQVCAEPKMILDDGRLRVFIDSIPKYSIDQLIKYSGFEIDNKLLKIGNNDIDVVTEVMEQIPVSDRLKQCLSVKRRYNNASELEELCRSEHDIDNQMKKYLEKKKKDGSYVYSIPRAIQLRSLEKKSQK